MHRLFLSLVALCGLLGYANEGSRLIPERRLRTPAEGVSPEQQQVISSPYPSLFNTHPKSPEEWKALVAQVAKDYLSEIELLKEKLGVTVTETKVAGVRAFFVAPRNLPEKNRKRLLVHLHGGGYVFFPGESGVREAVIMAGLGGFKILSIDYRMAPDFPYPAALDDAMAVWKELTKQVDPKTLGLFGTSAGGALTLSMILRAKEEHLPLPAAIASHTPWADLTETGDSYQTNEWIDNVLVTCSGLLGEVAKLYVGSHDRRDPHISPIYGDFHGFPPAVLITGTRDLFLSNTVRTHRKLRQAGVEAELHVYEGQSHAQFDDNPDAPETKEAISEVSRFFDRHLS